MSEEINLEKYIARARAFGLNVFYGSVNNHFQPSVIWDNEQGDYVKFLKLAKDVGAPIIVVDIFKMEDSDIDEEKLDEKFYAENGALEKVKEYNTRLEEFRKYVGKVGSVKLSWFMNGIEYSYMESLPWADSYFDLINEMNSEINE